MQNTAPEAPQRERQLFYALDLDGDGLVPSADIVRMLEEQGLGRTDSRLRDLFAQLDAAAGPLDLAAFVRIIGPAGLLVERALQGGLALPDFAHFAKVVDEIFREARSNESGKQADYIPPLAEVDANQFGLAVVTVDGQVLALGDADVDFSIQSTCKPFNYCFAVEALGEQKVHEHVGTEPSGRPFNARVLLEDMVEKTFIEDGKPVRRKVPRKRPHNPMINAGAIMCASLVKPEEPLHKRLKHIRQEWARLTGLKDARNGEEQARLPRFNAWMAREEERTGDNNRALAYMMKSEGSFLKGEDTVEHEVRDALNLYFSTCSLEVTCRELAAAAATLANGGVCPLSQETVLKRPTVRNCLSLMHTCGMYDYSGKFAFSIGLPAKSGVGGGVFLVVPGLMGICIWSPRLDSIGNSARGVQVAEKLTERYSLHTYDSVSAAGDRSDPRVPRARWHASLTSQALWAASTGDVRTLRRLQSEFVDLEKGDYDRRAPMHLAAAEGHVEALRFLLEHNVSPNVPDRWGGLPLDDAELAGHPEAAELLRAKGAQRGKAWHEADDPEGATDEHAHHGDADAVVELLWAANDGQITGLQRLVASGVPVHAADYDRRTALHLAAAEGQLEAVRYLVAHDHPINVRDRWNATPLDEARREQRDDVVAFLSSL
ncbi:MAG: glutaminase A [bacterium]|nr:glutaminase A [Myxococcales bacterium]